MLKINLVVCLLLTILQQAVAQSLPGASSAYAVIVAGGNGQGSAANQLNYPTGIFVDPAGNLYISDNFNHRIQKWAPGSNNGITVAGGNSIGSLPNQIFNPYDISVDSFGNIYVADYNNHRIQRWSPGASSGFTVAGGNGAAGASNQLYYPESVFVAPDNSLYIADVENHRIQKWLPGARSGTTVAGGRGIGAAANQLSSPTDLFVDKAGNIYVSDRGNNRIQKWAPGATLGITVAGGNGRGSGAGQLSGPNAVFVDESGNIYISDAVNSRIQKWAPGASSGVTVAGGNGYGLLPNQLAQPWDLFVDRIGSIYVVEYGSQMVRKFEAFNYEALSCPPDLKFVTAGCNDRAIISWTAPRDTFPVIIDPPAELDPHNGQLTYMGSVNGHGYYRSTNFYMWPVAAYLLKYIGDTAVDGHLVTISSAEENSFIHKQVKGSGYSPWIGLSSTGKPGQFEWVNGEPLIYTKWAGQEPNNSAGNARNLREPYVRLSDQYDGTWNDQRLDYFPFIAEFEAPLILYRQISGPANGSPQPPGVYEVCYEKNNLITGVKEVCCFKINVTCNAAALTTASNSMGTDNAASKMNNNEGLRIATLSNPSKSTFTLSITGNTHEPVGLVVTNESGRIIESRKGLTSGQTLELGKHYNTGLYFARFTQGAQSQVVKLIRR